MTSPPDPPGSPATTQVEVEEGLDFAPRFDAQGLIPAIVTDTSGGDVVMFAWMNAEALDLTLRTREAHFWSRSRQKLWRKGEDSGNTLMVEEVRVDCDQDALWLRVRIAGSGRACHTGRHGCFYRRLTAAPGAGGGPARLEPAAEPGVKRSPK